MALPVIGAREIDEAIWGLLNDDGEVVADADSAPSASRRRERRERREASAQEPSKSRPPALDLSVLDDSTPAFTECKSLSLRFATARSADTTGTRPTTGLLKLYSGMPRLPIDALAAAINVFTREKCTMNADVVAFRRLLASAATREQPQGWKTAWAATRLSDEERSQRAAFLLQKQQINDAFFN